MINEYACRKVALRDTKSCLVCHKPSTTVLYNKSGPDWFYTCDIHLQDNPQFATPVYDKEYENVLTKMKSLKNELNSNAGASGSSWDSWVSKVFIKKDKDADKPKDTDPANTPEPAVRTQAQIQEEYNATLDTLTTLRKKNKMYQLSPQMFESRVQLKKREEMLKEQRRKQEEAYTNTDPDELLTKFSFPQVPNTSTNEDNGNNVNPGSI